MGVPTNAILTMDNIPSSFKDQFPEGTAVQAIMAAYLTCGSEEELAKYALWSKVWPTREDFEDSLPMLWPTAIRGLTSPDTEVTASTSKSNVLPPCISGTWNTIQKGRRTHKYATEHQNLLTGQEQRLGKAWADVTAVLPDTDWRSFSYHWLILNTRSFYWVPPDREPPEDRNDAMAMLPFADYFNHADIEVSHSKVDYLRGASS